MTDLFRDLAAGAASFRFMTALVTSATMTGVVAGPMAVSAARFEPTTVAGIEVDTEQPDSLDSTIVPNPDSRPVQTPQSATPSTSGDDTDAEPRDVALQASSTAIKPSPTSEDRPDLSTVPTTPAEDPPTTSSSIEATPPSTADSAPSTSAAPPSTSATTIRPNRVTTAPSPTAVAPSRATTTRPAPTGTRPQEPVVVLTTTTAKPAPAPTDAPQSSAAESTIGAPTIENDRCPGAAWEIDPGYRTNCEPEGAQIEIITPEGPPGTSPNSTAARPIVGNDASTSTEPAVPTTTTSTAAPPTTSPTTNALPTTTTTRPSTTSRVTAAPTTRATTEPTQGPQPSEPVRSIVPTLEAPDRITGELEAESLVRGDRKPSIPS